ncbi:HWE histidine kinase domain-containing protein [Paracoccus benzoatiresistens]|uniref:histidine kinase n=1 Tax=Paracoccus benzoatiresistens TaxID=2997341 RepID=A0ABT4JCP9_9RHOB|nr:HWE histidine kinase domain-containing protein [Paracoccus sp. EF6]MCZ0964362.1 histidine kinase [Paracoccus sp. EF6]
MDLDELYRLLRGSHVQAVGVMNTLRDPLLVLDGDLTVLSANPAFYRAFEANSDDTVGVPFLELDNGQWNIPELRILLEGVIPKSAAIVDYEVQAEFPRVGFRNMLVSAQRLHHPENGKRILMLTILDATEQRKADDKKDILIGELDHRIKNLLMVMQALVAQTNVTGRSAEEYRDDLRGRLNALGRSIGVSRAGASATILPDLVRAVMEPYLEGASTLSLAAEPAVVLSGKQATSLGMILHEMATNALKYGALSVPEGRLSISWSEASDQEGRAEIHLRWEESGCSGVSPPEETGFGTQMIQFATEYDLKGSAELDYRPEGLLAKLTVPITSKHPPEV